MYNRYPGLGERKAHVPSPPVVGLWIFAHFSPGERRKLISTLLWTYRTPDQSTRGNSRSSPTLARSAARNEWKTFRRRTNGSHWILTNCIRFLPHPPLLLYRTTWITGYPHRTRRNSRLRKYNSRTLRKYKGNKRVGVRP